MPLPMILLDFFLGLQKAISDLLFRKSFPAAGPMVRPIYSVGEIILAVERLFLWLARMHAGHRKVRTVASEIANTLIN